MKNKKSIAMAVTAIVSAITLTATAFAASVNVSGYEALKQAGFAALDYIDNSTTTIDAKIHSDGQLAFSFLNYQEKNIAQKARYIREQTSDGTDYTHPIYESYESDGYSYTWSEFLNKYVQDKSYYGDYPSPNGVIFTLNQKKLIGILMDLAVGDVKNYFVSDGNRISVNLNKNQIPELAQSILDVRMEMLESTFDLADYKAKLIYNPSIESGTLTATLTDNGLPADVAMTADFTGMDKNGQTHTATLEIKIAFSNLGSTSPRIFDPTGKTKIWEK